MRITVVIPTTAGPLVIRSLKARAGLPASAAFADGDYRSLPWSGDYARLVGAGGPLAGEGGESVAAYELRLSGSFDTGRSWEAPVALAHALLERGHCLVGDPADAEVVVWATGALDRDLHLTRARYDLLDKVEQSQALFQSAPQARIIVLLPPDDGGEAASQRLAELLPGRVTYLAAGTIRDAAAELEAASPPATPLSEHMPERGKSAKARAIRLPVLLGAGGLVAAAAAAVAAFAFNGLVAPVVQAPVEVQVPVEVEEPVQSSPVPSGETVPPVSVPPVLAPPVPASAPVVIEELRAPTGQSCRAVVFDAAVAVRREVALASAQVFEKSRNDVSLCGLSFRLREAEAARIEISPNLKALAITPSRMPDGAQVLLFRDGIRQNVVYSVQVSVLQDGALNRSTSFTHALVP